MLPCVGWVAYDFSSMALSNVTLQAATARDLPVIRRLAYDIWWPTYGSYLVHDQISLMLELIYSEEALQAQLEAGQQFSLAMRGDVTVGFVGYQPKHGKAQTMRIEKLYVMPSEQGKGTGKLLIDYVTQTALADGYSCLELNVNRRNAAARFYDRQGFVIIDTVDIPYHGYVLNDYVMQKELARE